MKCANQECNCVMGSGSASYCCTPCALADEGSYEIAFHSEGCIERQAQRATFTDAFAQQVKDAEALGIVVGDFTVKEALRQHLLAQLEKPPTPFTDAINQPNEEWPGEDQPWWKDEERLDSER